MDLCNALANAAQFRVDRGETERAETLLVKATQMAERIGDYNDKFFAWSRLAHFLEDQGRDKECEQALRNAIDSVPLFSFGVRHAIGLKDLGAAMIRNGRPAEGLAIQCMALKLFETLADDLCLDTVVAAVKAS
jgi:hypothetical protein